MKAEDFFKENVVWNGTVVCNPINLMKAYHENELKDITREKILEGMSEYTEGKKDKQTRSRAFIKGCNYVLNLLKQ